MRERDYAYEALAEVTGTDMNAGRGELNAALKSIRAQEPEMVSMALADEIHMRARMYRSLFEGAALTPTALCKHWRRVKEESKRTRSTNMTTETPAALPTSRRDQNLAAARNLMREMGWKR